MEREPFDPHGAIWREYTVDLPSSEFVTRLMIHRSARPRDSQNCAPDAPGSRAGFQTRVALVRVVFALSVASELQRIEIHFPGSPVRIACRLIIEVR
jgi:hypothetical protein